MAASRDPSISIIIAVRNRAENVNRCLGRLIAQQGIPRADFEVVIDDDGSTDELREVVARFEPHLDVRIVGPTTATGPFRSAVGRNRAMAAARAEVILALDSDVLPGPFLVQAHLDRHRDRPGELVIAGAMAGYPSAITDRGPERMQAPPPEELFDRLPELLMKDHALWADPRRDILARWPGLVGCPFGWLFIYGFNMSFGRRAALEAGGFDEQFSGWGSEDTEFTYRLHRRGLAMRYEPRAWAVHTPHPTRFMAAEVRRQLDYIIAKHECPHYELVAWGAYDPPREAEAQEVRLLLAERERPSRLSGPELTTALIACGVARDARVAWFGAIPHDTGVVPAVHSRPLEAASSGGSHAGCALLGLFLPWPAGELDAAVVVDYWARLERLPLLSLGSELLRVARQVHFVGAGAAERQRLARWFGASGAVTTTTRTGTIEVVSLMSPPVEHPSCVLGKWSAALR
jgi:glycosyltransferase involved in cell wall biosynthesis